VTALLLAFVVFLAWSAVGLAALALTRADTSELRVILIAPALGSAVTVVVGFILSFAGLSMGAVAVPLIVVLLAASTLTLSLRRPSLPRAVAPILVLCLAGLLLAGWPLLSLGFDWLGNGNADMGDYVLRAVQLLHQGLLAPLDSAGLNRGSDYATTLVGPNLWGERPGSEVVLALLARVSGRAPYEVYMPMGLALGLVSACGAGALARSATARASAAIVAVTLVLVSPLFTFGIMQELLPQTWGLAISVALLALLMRVEIHRDPGARLADLVPIGVLTSALVLVYVEITPEVAAAYGLYVVLVVLRREVTARALARLWIPALAIVFVLLNAYLIREVGFLRDAGQHGVTSEHPPLFGYVAVPSALPSVLGLQLLPPGADAPLLNLSILATGILLLAGLASCLAGLRRASAPAVVLVVDAGLTALLIAKGADFGLFKLSMYVQPFLAAMIAVWASSAKRRSVQVLVGGALAALIVFQLSTQRAYVRASRSSELAPDASSAQLLPAFAKTISSHSGPVVSITENPFIIQLEAAAADGHQVAFLDRDAFIGYLSIYVAKTSGARHRQVVAETHLYPWKKRRFDLRSGSASDEFKEDQLASQSLASPNCELVIPSGQTLVLNRRSLPASAPALVSMPCSAAHDLLAFTQSDLGESFYIPASQRTVSFAQLQTDPYMPGQTMAGFGRYALFRVLGPTTGMRLELDFTTTLNADASNRIPPVGVVGVSRVALPVVGNGSARVFSAPLQPQMIAGQPYVLLNMETPSREPPTPRSGVQALYGRSIPLDIRFLTSYVRDVSLISAQQYQELQPPSSISRFPSDLANPNLQYSGLYEDGWMGADAYAVLAGGGPAELVLKAEVPEHAGKHLTVLVNGRPVLSMAIAPGALDLGVPLPASAASRRVELRFAATIHLAAPDLRPAAAHLSYLGLTPRT
jgi:hypothetical protein